MYIYIRVYREIALRSLRSLHLAKMRRSLNSEHDRIESYTLVCYNSTIEKGPAGRLVLSIYPEDRSMAREFAKAFYSSMAWQRARADYINKRKAIDGGMCELCQDAPGTEVHHKVFLRPENIDDPDITLNPENFMLVCYDCHQREHEAARRVAMLRAKQLDGQKGVLIGGSYYLDDDGEPQPFKAYIVWGCPGSGKSTYVRQHMQPGDVVIDLDLIGRALSFAEKTDVPRNVERIAYDVRDYLYKQVQKRKLDAKHVWIVAGLPQRKQRLELARKLDAELIFIDSTFTECYQHALQDPERIDKALQLAIIERWFRDFEPDPPPSAPA